MSENKKRKILFTTVDGKPVYNNGKVFVIVSNNFTNSLTRRIVKSYAHEHSGGLRYKSVQNRAFSTKKAAVKYINKLLEKSQLL